MIARFLALALCAAPFFAQALPAAVIEDLEQVNITTADIEIMLNKRAGDAACPDATGQTSKWANQGNDGNGHYAGSCGSTDHGKAHCWSDIYLTQAQTLWQPWRDCSEYVNCANSDSCQISHLKSIQACATWSTSVGFEAGITSEILNVGASYTSEHGGSSCATTTDTYQIGWKDDACHKLVASAQIVRLSGYIRRTCKKPLHNEPQRSDGDYTRGWTDWQADFPTGKWEYSGKYHCDVDASQKTNELPPAGKIYPVKA
ncbi:hypothetical protein POX_d05196 [Penicillium oxalicum]|uniref:hypothetical protein n=1 Tax=Penicillium oxalicum TaxID=69781 RepID=UPI0020B8042D|nr:hypothetical protein POX_d05196 [Penicillium oxalicum]KAI2789699.1 hypothetical protein POX_d05196 [Penicillium oxalicum]